MRPSSPRCYAGLLNNAERASVFTTCVSSNPACAKPPRNSFSPRRRSSIDRHPDVEELAPRRIIAGRDDIVDGEDPPLRIHRLQQFARIFHAGVIVPIVEDVLQDVGIAAPGTAAMKLPDSTDSVQRLFLGDVAVPLGAGDNRRQVEEDPLRLRARFENRRQKAAVSATDIYDGANRANWYAAATAGFSVPERLVMASPKTWRSSGCCSRYSNSGIRLARTNGTSPVLPHRKAPQTPLSCSFVRHERGRTQGARLSCSQRGCEGRQLESRPVVSAKTPTLPARGALDTAPPPPPVAWARSSGVRGPSSRRSATFNFAVT